MVTSDDSGDEGPDAESGEIVECTDHTKPGKWESTDGGRVKVAPSGSSIEASATADVRGRGSWT